MTGKPIVELTGNEVLLLRDAVATVLAVAPLPLGARARLAAVGGRLARALAQAQTGVELVNLSPTSDKSAPAVLTVAQMARELGCSPSYVCRLARLGRLPGAWHTSAGWLIPADAVQDPEPDSVAS